LFFSSLPERLSAAAIAGGGQYATPFSFAVAPSGRVRSRPFTSCCPAGRVMRVAKEVKVFA
jgi:hypothetical protein